jgi:methionyl-tRNA formyltransferase
MSQVESVVRGGSRALAVAFAGRAWRANVARFCRRTEQGDKLLRIVTFNVLVEAYRLIAAWAARHGHQIVLVVTSPAGSAERYGTGYLRLVESLPPTQDVLITTRMRKTALPAIAALAPDLILSATFPHRIPPDLAAVPRYGALNLHPAPLPRGRGPNPQRLIYEGDPITGATLHRIAPAFDAGPILSRQVREVPPDVTPEAIFTAWGELLLATLEEGVPRAVAGEIGEPQDEALATYAAPFSDAERWLEWNEPAELLQRRVAALNLGGPTARAALDGEAVTILSLRPLVGAVPDVAAGTVLRRDGDRAMIRTADSTVEVKLIGDQSP